MCYRTRARTPRKHENVASRDRQIAGHDSLSSKGTSRQLDRLLDSAKCYFRSQRHIRSRTPRKHGNVSAGSGPKGFYAAVVWQPRLWGLSRTAMTPDRRQTGSILEVDATCISTPRKRENTTRRAAQGLGLSRLRLRSDEGLWAGRGRFSGPRLWSPLPFRPRSMGEG